MPDGGGEAPVHHFMQGAGVEADGTAAEPQELRVKGREG